MKIQLITQRIRFSATTSDITKKKTLKRVKRICQAIEEAFVDVRRPEQLKLKHVQYVKNVWFERQEFADATIKDYARALRLLVAALDREKAWLNALNLEKDPSVGGRPTTIKIIRSRAVRRRGVF